MTAVHVEPTPSGPAEPHLHQEAVEGIQAGAKIMPIYLVLDRSLSMKEEEELLNQVARELKELAANEPEVADVAHICVIGFSSTAQVLVPLSDIRDAVFPTIVADGGTNYTAALELLARTIEADVNRLAAAKAKVFRALVWFLTDGEPQDLTWEETFKRLFDYNAETGAGNARYPRFVPLGFRQANPDVLARMAYPPQDGLAYLSKPGMSPKEAFGVLLELICRTTVASGLTAPSDAAAHVFPKDVPGVEATPSQYAGGSWLT